MTAKLERDVGRGARAQTLIENELLGEAFAELESAYVVAWRSTEVGNQVGREKLFLAINVVGKVREHLHIAIANGKLAANELAGLAAEAERKKRRGDN